MEVTSSPLEPAAGAGGSGVLEHWIRDLVVATLRDELRAWAQRELPVLIREEVRRAVSRVSGRHPELSLVQEAYGDEVFPFFVKDSIRFAECPPAGRSILEYASDTDGAKAYRQLADKVLTHA